MRKSRFPRLAAIVLAAATLWITAVTAGADSLHRKNNVQLLRQIAG